MYSICKFQRVTFLSKKKKNALFSPLPETLPYNKFTCISCKFLCSLTSTYFSSSVSTHELVLTCLKFKCTSFTLFSCTRVFSQLSSQPSRCHHFSRESFYYLTVSKGVWTAMSWNLSLP